MKNGDIVQYFSGSIVECVYPGTLDKWGTQKMRVRYSDGYEQVLFGSFKLASVKDRLEFLREKME